MAGFSLHVYTKRPKYQCFENPFELAWKFEAANSSETLVEASWNVMAHAQNPDFVLRRNGRVYLNRRGRQFSRLLAAEVCASAVVMLDTPCSEVVWRVMATHSTRQFPLTSPPVRHRVPSHFNWSLHTNKYLRRHIPENWNININETILSHVTTIMVKGNITETNCALLGCYAASSDKFVPTFRDNL